MPDRCPGSANLRTPTLSIAKCPECGHEIEIFSSDARAVCSNCGFVVYNNITSCVRWCRHAKSCIGEEMYRALVEKKVD